MIWTGKVQSITLRKWFDRMLCGCLGQASDVEHHLQQAAKAFQKHRWMLQCKDCSIKHRLRYFEAVVSSTACFAAEHRPLYGKHLGKYDVQFRKFVRCIVGPPPAQIGQHTSISFCMTGICVEHWSNQCKTQYWNFAS